VEGAVAAASPPSGSSRRPRHAEALGVFHDRLEDLRVEFEILLKSAVFFAEFLIVADEGSDDDVVRVAAEQVGDADEAQDVVLVGFAFGGVAADQIVVAPTEMRSPSALQRAISRRASSRPNVS
jgi:hypothetical protein